MTKETSSLAKRPNEIDIEVGAKIRMRRWLVGMTQKKLGDTVGVTFQQIQKYERGTNRVGASRMLQIANALAVPASFFFEGENKAASDHPHPYEDLVAFIASPEGAALNQAFAKIENAAVRARIVALVKAIGKDHPSALEKDR